MTTNHTTPTAHHIRTRYINTTLVFIFTLQQPLPPVILHIIQHPTSPWTITTHHITPHQTTTCVSWCTTVLMLWCCRCCCNHPLTLLSLLLSLQWPWRHSPPTSRSYSCTGCSSAPTSWTITKRSLVKVELKVIMELQVSIVLPFIRW